MASTLVQTENFYRKKKPQAGGRNSQGSKQGSQKEQNLSLDEINAEIRAYREGR